MYLLNGPLYTKRWVQQWLGRFRKRKRALTRVYTERWHLPSSNDPKNSSLNARAAEDMNQGQQARRSGVVSSTTFGRTPCNGKCNLEVEVCMISNNTAVSNLLNLWKVKIQNYNNTSRIIKMPNKIPHIILIWCSLYITCHAQPSRIIGTLLGRVIMDRCL